MDGRESVVGQSEALAYSRPTPVDTFIRTLYSVFDDLGIWILDADHGRLVILEFGSWIFLEGILRALVILDLGSWIFRFHIPDSGTVLESGGRRGGRARGP